MSPMNRLAGRAAVLGLVLAPLASAQSADTSSEATFHKAYYLECEKGDLEGALKIYKHLAENGSSKELRQAAKERGTAVWEELASSDFARLVPEDTIVYVEINNPGEQLSSLLGQLGLLQGSEGSGNVAISPRLIDGLLGVRGAAIALTHVDPTGGMPDGVAILHPGDMDIVAGLLETALPAAGQPVDPIGGYATYQIEGMVYVTMTERLVLAALNPDQIVGVLKRIENGGQKSLANNPDLTGTLAMRGDDLAFFCVNLEPIMPTIQAMLGQMAQHEPEMAMAMSLLDVASTQAIAGRIGVGADGVSIDLGLQLAEDHNNVLFNLMRMPHVRKSTLELIPSGSAFWMATALNEKGAIAKGPTNSKGEPIVTMMDIGREVFGNVVDIALYAMPGTTEVHGEQIPDIALALTVNDPARSRAIWNLVLGIAKGATGGGSMEPKVTKSGNAVIERYDIEGVGLYVMTDGNRLVFTPSKKALEAAIGASSGKNVLTDKLYHSTLKSLNENQTMALAVSPGRAMKIAKNYMGERELQEIGPYMGMIENTVVALSVEHSDTTLAFSAQVTGLPKVGHMVSQLVAQQLHGGGGHAAWSAPVAAASDGWSDAPEEPVIHASIEPAPASAYDSKDTGDLQEKFEKLVAEGRHDAARKLVDPIAKGLGSNALELNNLAWYLLTEDRYDGKYNDLALPIAVKANELSGGENWYYLDTLGHALAANGQYEQAVKVQSVAVELGRAQGDSGVDAAAKALDEFKKALGSEF